MVVSQAKIWIALGMDTVMLAAPKKLIESSGSPVANMWWTHTPKPTSPVATVASATNVCPIIGRRENVGMTIDSIPVAGKNTMYTQGCPNTQNRCCHNSALPPRVGSKNTKCQCRSSSRKISATESAGTENTTATDIVREL